MSTTKKIRVAVAGASGETGRSITAQLLATPEQFAVLALARPESAEKDEYKKLAQNGAAVEAVDFRDTGALTTALAGVDVVISCLLPTARAESEALIDAAHGAGVGRFVPSFFATAAPPRGVMMLREIKEDLLDRCKRLYLPYTVIDVGWWYHIGLPAVAAGGPLAEAISFGDVLIADGAARTAMIDQADIGRYVARIIADPRTLNRAVFAYGEVTTQNAVWAAVEAQADADAAAVSRETVSAADLEAKIAALRTAHAANPADVPTLLQLGATEYQYSRGVRGDNTPEHAAYLGYLDAKALYPDLECTSVSDFVRALHDGVRDAKVYVGRNLFATSKEDSA